MIQELKNLVKNTLRPDPTKKIRQENHDNANDIMITNLSTPIGMAVPYFGEVYINGINSTDGKLSDLFIANCPNFLPLDGRSLPISQYEDLYKIISNKFGNKDAEHFNLPNLMPGGTLVQSGKGEYSRGNNLNGKVEFTVGGAECVTEITHESVSGDEIETYKGGYGGYIKAPLKEKELPSHWHYLTHSDTAWNVNHDRELIAVANRDKQITGSSRGNTPYDNNNSYVFIATDGQASAGRSGLGSGQNMYHENMPPFMVCNWIMRVK